MTTTDQVGSQRARTAFSRPRVRSLLLVGLFVVFSILYLVPTAWSVSRDNIESVSSIAYTAWGATAAALVIVVGSVAVIWRRSRPALFFAVCAVGYLILSITLGNRVLATGPPLMYALFCMGRRARPRTMLTLVGALVVVDTIVQCTMLSSVTALMMRLDIGGFQATLLIFVSSLANNGFFTLVGFGAALYDRRREASRELARAQLSEHDARLREALAAERNRMARELHDMAAHHLTALIIEAKAAKRLQLTDPDTTAELLSDITVQGQQTLDSMRSIVGVLRQTDGQGADGGPSGGRLPDAGDHMPQPTLGDVPALVDAARTINGRIIVDLPADLDNYDATIGLASYRIIQESLSNAHRHAPGAPIRVKVTTTDASIVVAVTNARPEISPERTQPGFGLAGMRERAAILGGTLTSGATDEGGWRVRAELPLAAADAPAATREIAHD